MSKIDDVVFAAKLPKTKKSHAQLIRRVPALLPTTEASKERQKRSVFPDFQADAVDDYAAPRVVTKADDR